MSSYHKETFDKIPEAKRKRVLDAAIVEFARHGYEAVSTNTIAERAEISIGSLYSYFASKQDLFMAIIDQGYQLMRSGEKEVLEGDGRFEQRIYRLFNVAARYGKNHADMTKLYLLLSTEEMSSLSNKMAKKFEIGFTEAHKAIVQHAIDQGELPPDVDVDYASFVIANQVLMLQFSFASKFHKKRLERYLGEEKMKDIPAVVQYLTDFVVKALA